MIRFSTLEQSGMGMVEPAKAVLRDYCRKRGLHVVKWYIDCASGCVPIAERVAGGRLLTDAAQGEFDTVVVQSLCRLGRLNAVFLDALERFKALGVTVESVREGITLGQPLFEALDLTSV